MFVTGELDGTARPRGARRLAAVGARDRLVDALAILKTVKWIVKIK